ncbi:hypothetical protein B0H13DRAFT_2300756 [Mycena leptocephala]|nr:hypothetical protein B0H13DRAFT_2300756 [Mycena leptocephala]
MPHNGILNHVPHNGILNYNTILNPVPHNVALLSDVGLERQRIMGARWCSVTGAWNSLIYRTICIASDGEARRGASLVLQATNRELSSTSPIYDLLSPLELMNLRVRDDDVTPDKDYRHVPKTPRNLLMRLKGVKLLGCVITPAIIKHHLRPAGHSKEQVNSYLNPNDKQDVFLGYSLLKSLWSLPVPEPTAHPSSTRTRNALRMFGQLGYHLLTIHMYLL